MRADTNGGEEETPEISVIIPCLNEERHIVELLKALQKQSFSDFEVVIADGGSRDHSVELIRSFRCQNPSMKLWTVPNARGTISAGLNLAIRDSSGRIIIRLDGHCLPSPDYLCFCRRALAESGASVVGGVCIIRPEQVGGVPSSIALAMGSILGAGDAAYKLERTRSARYVDTVPFGCYLRTTWEQVGGYNEKLLSNEDYEFNYRIRKDGAEVYLDPRIRIEYFARGSLAALIRQFWRYGWWKAQMLKLYPRSLKMRQLIPAVWVACALLVPFLSIHLESLRIIAVSLWMLYLTAVIASCLVLALRHPWKLCVPLLIVYPSMHFSWGVAFWISLFRRTDG